MARRCSRCGLSWPNFLEFKSCPKCGEDTDLLGNEKPMSLADASSLKRHLEFDRRYEAHEAGRQGPSPEELGRREAAEIIELEREFHRDTCGRCGASVNPIICEFREPVCPECWRAMNGDAA